MRLIDADKIEYHQRAVIEDVKNVGMYLHKRCITEDEINAIPTEINAIPTAKVSSRSIPVIWILDYITDKTQEGTLKRQYFVDMFVTWCKEQEQKACGN